MLSRAAITVSTGTDFVVERAVDFVLFCTEDRGKVVGHDCDICVELLRLMRKECTVLSTPEVMIGDSNMQT